MMQIVKNRSYSENELRDVLDFSRTRMRLVDLMVWEREPGIISDGELPRLQQGQYSAQFLEFIESFPSIIKELPEDIKPGLLGEFEYCKERIATSTFDELLLCLKAFLLIEKQVF